MLAGQGTGSWTGSPGRPAGCSGTGPFRHPLTCFAGGSCWSSTPAATPSGRTAPRPPRTGSWLAQPEGSRAFPTGRWQRQAREVTS